MEKSITDMLAVMSYKDVMNVVINACRTAKDKVPVFKETGNGCVVTMFVPLCQEADIWLGGLSKYDASGKAIDVHEYIEVSTIAPGGSHTIQWRDPRDGHYEPVNCLAYAMMKIAYLAHLIKNDILTRDEDEEAINTGYYCEENGYSTHLGAVCATIYYNGKPLMRAYNSFSGADEKEDLLCAAYTSSFLKGYMYENDTGFTFESRSVLGMLPLEVE